MCHRLFTLIVFCVFASAAGCQRSVDRPLAIGGAEAVAAVRTADAATAYRLLTNEEYRPSVSEYEIEEGPVALSLAVRDRLCNVLLNQQTSVSKGKACIPDFRIRFRFQSEATDVDILLCLECRIMAIYHDSKAFTCADFDDIAPELIAISKEIFPNDPLIQTAF